MVTREQAQSAVKFLIAKYDGQYRGLSITATEDDNGVNVIDFHIVGKGEAEKLQTKIREDYDSAIVFDETDGSIKNQIEQCLTLLSDAINLILKKEKEKEQGQALQQALQQTQEAQQQEKQQQQEEPQQEEPQQEEPQQEASVPSSLEDKRSNIRQILFSVGMGLAAAIGVGVFSFFFFPVGISLLAALINIGLTMLAVGASTGGFAWVVTGYSEWMTNGPNMPQAETNEGVRSESSVLPVETKQQAMLHDQLEVKKKASSSDDSLSLSTGSEVSPLNPPCIDEPGASLKERQDEGVSLSPGR